MVLKHVKQIFKSYVTKWLKWPVITDHYPIFAALHNIRITFAISRVKTEKHTTKKIELNSCKKLICDLSKNKYICKRKKDSIKYYVTERMNLKKRFVYK